MILSFERESSRSHYVEEPFWKRLWTCRQTEYWINGFCKIFRSQWPRGLRRRSTAARLLRSWVRITPEALIFVCVCVVRCQVEVSATNWSLAQRNVSWLWHGYKEPCHSQLTFYACNIPNAACRAPPEDEQVMLETCRGPLFSINWMKSASRWFQHTGTKFSRPGDLAADIWETSA
jgi:hypothetical protein